MEFLDKEHEKDIQIKGVREDEIHLFDIDRDYVKELDNQLAVNNVPSAKDLFDELKKIYNTIPEYDPLRKKVFGILKDMYNEIKKYTQRNQFAQSLIDEVKKLDYSAVFQSQVPPKTMPVQKITSIQLSY